MPNKSLEEPLESLANMTRCDLIKALKQLQCHFELDFTDEFLDGLSLERLRHTVLAAMLHARKITSVT